MPAPSSALGSVLARRLGTVASSGVVAWAVLTWVVAPVTVGSGSMSPTYCEGDVVLVLRPGAPARAESGQVVTLDAPGPDDQWIKRVVAVRGQTVGIDDGRLVVDGVVVPEPYVDQRTVDGTFTRAFSVGPDSVFVLGDSRELAVDSRDVGPVGRSSVTGTVLGRLWSGCPG